MSLLPPTTDEQDWHDVHLAAHVEMVRESERHLRLHHRMSVMMWCVVALTFATALFTLIDFLSRVATAANPAT